MIEAILKGAKKQGVIKTYDFIDTGTSYKITFEDVSGHTYRLNNENHNELLMSVRSIVNHLKKKNSHVRK